MLKWSPARVAWKSWGSVFLLSIGGESSWRTFSMQTNVYRLLISASIYRFGANSACSSHRVISVWCQWLYKHCYELCCESVNYPKLRGRDSHNYLRFHKWHYSLRFICFSLSTLGIQNADEEEMKLMASTPHRSHIYSVANFNMIKTVQKELISQVCAGVDDQLTSLVSGEEGEMWSKTTFIPRINVTSGSNVFIWSSTINILGNRLFAFLLEVKINTALMSVSLT